MKTDARDARELCGHLDRYLAGNDRALCVVRVPSLEQEQERSLSRQRETLAKERKRLQNVGTSSGLYHGVDVPSNGWKPKVFADLCAEIPDFLKRILEPFQQVLEAVWRMIQFQPDYKPIKHWKTRQANEPFGVAGVVPYIAIFLYPSNNLDSLNFMRSKRLPNGCLYFHEYT